MIFFNYISDRWLGEKALLPWREYMEGKKTHFEALKEIFSSLRVTKRELDDFICKIKIDQSFFTVADYCCRQHIPVYICSAGCDYYIDKLIGKEMAKNWIKLVANHGVYSPEKGLVMNPLPENNPFYAPNTGVDKAAVVAYLQQKGYCVVYCGDGMPDVAAAAVADVVFARKMLLHQCRLLHIPAEELKDFDEVYHFLKG